MFLSGDDASLHGADGVDDAPLDALKQDGGCKPVPVSTTAAKTVPGAKIE
jgi:hypothetical protein